MTKHERRPFGKMADKRAFKPILFKYDRADEAWEAAIL